MKSFLQVFFGIVLIGLIIGMFQFTKENIQSRLEHILRFKCVVIEVYIPFFSYLYHTNTCYAEVFVDGNTRIIEFHTIGIMFLEESTIFVKPFELMKLGYHND